MHHLKIIIEFAMYKYVCCETKIKFLAVNCKATSVFLTLTSSLKRVKSSFEWAKHSAMQNGE